jgi:hypothetical protein
MAGLHNSSMKSEPIKASCWTNSCCILTLPASNRQNGNQVQVVFPGTRQEDLVCLAPSSRKLQHGTPDNCSTMFQKFTEHAERIANVESCLWIPGPLFLHRQPY